MSDRYLSQQENPETVSTSQEHSELERLLAEGRELRKKVHEDFKPAITIPQKYREMRLDSYVSRF
jgi:hypothetical protein